MSSSSSPFLPLALAALTAIGVAYGINQLGSAKKPEAKQTATVTPKQRWTATAAGRVEPKSGEVKLAARSQGRIEDVLVKVNDKVAAGDLLVRLDDRDAFSRIMAADAEAGVRKRERDTEKDVPKLAQDRRKAEDDLNDTERAISMARIELDQLILQQHADPSSVTTEQMATQRRALAEALKGLEPDREELRRRKLAQGVPLPTRLEAGLTAARADLSQAEEALERTRVRAPIDATVIEVQARVGELASPSPEQVLVVVGDLSELRVRAEVEERNVANVKVGQDVVLKADAFPEQEFTGKVATIATAMRPPKLAHKGPRRPNELDMLEVMVDVDPGSPLRPGMRVDVFFKEPPLQPTASSSDAVKSADAKAAESNAQTGAVVPAAATAATPAPASVASGSAQPGVASDAPQVLPPLPGSEPATTSRN